MVNEYKKIVLQKGLDPLNEYHFRMVKSLLATELKLTKTMQKDYDKIQIADLMEEKFPGVVCVEKLINIMKDVPELKDIMNTLKKEKTRVANKLRARGTAGERSTEEEPTTSGTTTSRGTETATPRKKKKTANDSTETKTPASQKQTPKASHPPPAPASTSASTSASTQPSTSQTEEPKQQATPKAAGPSSILQNEPMTVMVVTATKIFDYESPEKRKITMFHATVVTEKDVFHVKVFNPQLKNKFTSRNIIIMSNYFKNKGFLEVKESSSVTEAGPEQNMTVSKIIIKTAKETPKIIHLQSQASGTIVTGSFKFQKKSIKGTKTIYEIQDDTGTMDVVGEGRWHDMACDEGDQLQLTCFQLRIKEHKRILTTETHSFMQIKKNPKQKNSASVHTQPPQQQSQTPEASTLEESKLQTPQMPPPTKYKMCTSEKEEERNNVPDEPPREVGTQPDPKEVVVLKVTDSFAYEGILGEKWMFHATVATESQFFRVKVFDISLMNIFTPGSIIGISQYISRAGFLEIYSVSSVSVLTHHRQMTIPKALMNAATATPQIRRLSLEAPGTCVNGVYEVFEKIIRNACIYYKIQDHTGMMEVLVYGRLTSILCDRGDKVELICFELSEDRKQLRSIAHSFLKVFRASRNDIITFF
ncbi:gamma-interferon-inducible protein 16-like [Erinaceus europaeus]|uniref:Gamma-interferon-inducible protein 16-like n=1 Tax=Erinaceus europaeus TaxID=9365 RepID=A0A1S3WKR7_ERIEU|nr:gamma-interferon-inducible protein 16-like [Erinaceus europaeus]